MNLNDQVCTLSQAKKLQELGIEQRKGLFEWCVFMPDPLGEKWFYAPVYFQEEIEPQLHEWIASAYTASELGIMLPTNPSSSVNYSYYHRYNWKGHSVGYTALGLIPIEREWFKTEAEARADLLIHLLENKTITPEECNKRLQD